MPAETEKQRKMMAIAKHHPSKLYKRNKAVLKMSKEQLGEFAAKKKDKGFYGHMNVPKPLKVVGGPKCLKM